MNLKIMVLSLALSVSAGMYAQTARNPLNCEPVQSLFAKDLSHRQLHDMTFYYPNGKPFDRSVYAYDENGRKASELVQHLVENEWVNITKEEYSYEANRTTVLAYKWQEYEWEQSSKTDIFRNTEGRNDYALNYSFDRSLQTWTPSLRSEWRYDKNGRLTEYLKEASGRVAASKARIIYNYGEDGLMNMEVYQRENPEDKSWLDNGLYIYSTDNEGNKTATSYYVAGLRRICDGRTVSLFDSDGSLVRCNYYNGPNSSSISAYCIYNYSNYDDKSLILNEKSLVVSPNPATDFFELVMDESFVGKTAGLYDSSGRRVKSLTISDKRTNVDVSGLSSGVYFLNTGNVSKKIIIK